MIIQMPTTGERWSSPSKGEMAADITRMKSAFPVGIGLNGSWIPTCLLTALNGLSAGVLQALKNFLNIELVEVDLVLAAAQMWLAFVELTVNGYYRIAATFYNGLVQQGITAYEGWVEKLVESMAHTLRNATTIRGSSSMVKTANGVLQDSQTAVAIQNAAMTAVASCIPLAALLKCIEDVLVTDPIRFLQSFMVKLRDITAFINDLKLLIEWLQAKKDFYQKYINSIDFVISNRP